MTLESHVKPKKFSLFVFLIMASTVHTVHTVEIAMWPHMHHTP